MKSLTTKNKIIAVDPSGETWISEEYEPDLASVIIPTYNRAHLIIETLDSVFEQTYRPIEIIIVDDGSTDNTADVINKWKEIHTSDMFEIKYVIQENKGAPVARNEGAILSKGEYIQFFDSDDLMLPEKISKQVKAIQSKNKCWCGCLYKNFKEKPDNVYNEKSVSLKDDITFNEAFQKRPKYNVPILTPAGLYKRNILNLVGRWEESLRIRQDTEFCFRILANNFSNTWIAEPLFLVRITDNSITNRPISLIYLDMFYAMKVMEIYAKKNELLSESLKNYFGEYFAWISRKLIIENKRTESNLMFKEALTRLTYINKAKHLIHRIIGEFIGFNILNHIGLM